MDQTQVLQLRNVLDVIVTGARSYIFTSPGMY